LTEPIIVALTVLAGTLLAPVFTKFSDTVIPLLFGKPKKDPVGQAIALAGKIEEKLNTIRMNIGADMAHIIQFHNGGTFYPTGKSIAKFSVIYESLGINRNSIQLTYQGVPVAAYWKLIDGVCSDRFIKIEDINNPLTPDVYNLSAASQLHGWKSYYAFGMFDINERMIGVIMFYYFDRTRTLTDLEINTILSESGVIGGVLQKHLDS